MSVTTLGGLSLSVAAEGVVAGVIVARGCRLTPASAELQAELQAAQAEAVARSDEASFTQPVRALLRYGSYKPTGRAKPASEYLLRAARREALPAINNLVDAGNLVSLRSLLPLSVIDLGRAQAEGFVLRRGRPGERYVFNPAGQEIDLKDLLLVARLPDDRPVANPVKDSMLGKLDDAAEDVLCVIYGSELLAPLVEQATDQLAALLTREGQPRQLQQALLR